MSPLAFRNVDVSPDEPVSSWPLEAIQTALKRASGLTRAEFASRIGTSASRLSTYVTGKVTPSAALLVRMRRVTERESPPKAAS